MFTVTMCDRELLVPVTWIMYVPGITVSLAATINGEVATDPGIGVTGDVIDTRTPTGAVPTHEVVNVTVELKLLRGLIMIVVDPVPPCAIVSVGVDEVNKKLAFFTMLVLFVEL